MCRRLAQTSGLFGNVKPLPARSGADLHPISRACMGYHLWSLAGLRPTHSASRSSSAPSRQGSWFRPSAVLTGGSLASGQSETASDIYGLRGFIGAEYACFAHYPRVFGGCAAPLYITGAREALRSPPGRAQHRQTRANQGISHKRDHSASSCICLQTVVYLRQA